MVELTNDLSDVDELESSMHDVSIDGKWMFINFLLKIIGRRSLMASENTSNMICFIVIERDIIDQVESSIPDLSIDGMFHCTFLR